MSDSIPVDKMTAVTNIATASESYDAIQIAREMMADENIRMHGPEHHYIVAASVLAAYCNRFCPEDKGRLLLQARQRTIIIPPAMCALCGCCGAMIGAGAAVSIVIQANPYSEKTLAQVNRAAAAIHTELTTFSGIRCCKRSVWTAVRGAVEGLNRELGLDMKCSDVECEYKCVNESCIGDRCIY